MKIKPNTRSSGMIIYAEATERWSSVCCLGRHGLGRGALADIGGASASDAKQWEENKNQPLEQYWRSETNPSGTIALDDRFRI
ncbi:hypothetical protein J2W39_000053 [Variovorax paradoxus]|uniref:Uncharacterized protein n=1 Tax=Variovorax paradoxus TaxID=34073 RepID=A0AAW8E8E7_VARPD|nr:hypothetical protein [Variovorax paradoxus]MDP9968830.1 hypothetical protein [Variovorax paradoxus]